VANFVYGDSCVSGDDKYVIAQFRQDDPMEWVADLRAFLVQDELKYKSFSLNGIGCSLISGCGGASKLALNAQKSPS
jgi:hypothetical protein